MSDPMVQKIQSHPKYLALRNILNSISIILFVSLINFYYEINTILDF